METPPENKAPRFKTKVTPAYLKLRTLYLAADAWESRLLESGKVTVLLNEDSDFSTEGNLNPRGGLGGMAKLYKRLDLREGMHVEYSIPSKNTIVIYSPTPPAVSAVPALSAPPTPVALTQTVFERKKLAHIHLEPFRPESLNHWEPETETDVYLAFGVLQEFTDYQYCCGASKALLMRLGAFDEKGAKPDAILIDRSTQNYLMAEWKMRSSAFATNHKPEDIDVLVCWIDDAEDKTKLPPNVVSLKEIAKEAAAASLLDDSSSA